MILNNVNVHGEETEKLRKENDQLKLEIEYLTHELNASKESRVQESDKSDKRFKRLFNHLTDAVYYFKIYDDGSASTFIEVNETACQRLGYTREEMLTLSPKQIDGCGTEELKPVIKDVYDSITFETVHVCKNGDRIPVEIKTHRFEVEKEMYLLSVCRDITERKNSEREIREAKEQFENIVESSTNGITILQDGKWVFANKAALTLFDAKTKEELLGRNIYDMLHPEFHMECKEIVKNGGIHPRLYRVWTTLSGREIHTEVVSIPTTFQGKEANELIMQDITEQKKSDSMMIQAEKMNVVGQLAAGIAHEIRNPLTALKGFVQLFRSGTIPNEMFLNIMEAELERIDVISSEFLTLAQPANTDFTTVDIRDLVNDVIDLLDTEAFKKSISLVVENNAIETAVNGIGTQLKQVFINLIKNAIEVMQNEGTITIAFENHEGFILISVHDEGVGMSEEQLKWLGEPFFTTKQNGTGLGLMVTYRIINQHNGVVDVESKVNVGTTFTVKLPLIAER